MGLARTGSIAGKGDAWVDVKPEKEGPVERYAAKWVGGERGGFDKDMVRVIDRLKVGDKVLYGKYSGTETTIDGKEFLIMRESDIFAVA